MKQLLWIILFVPVLSFSQYDVEEGKVDSVKSPKINVSNLRDKIYVGSGLNLLLGTTTFIYVSPQIGYDILPKWSAGISTLFQYTKYNYSSTASDQVNSFGTGIYTRFMPIKQLILETSYNKYWSTYNQTYKIKSNAFMVGLGYARQFGNKSYYQIMLQYDLLRDFNVPEPSIITFNSGRIYYKFGLIFYLSDFSS
ncbi:MAG: hypothetical protein ACWA41_07020 [Putridiphycobacter sp.]